MANNSQFTWIKDSLNGRGWENSIEISSFEELRNNFIDLGASISFDDDSFGITNANVHVDSKLITAETTIDSYRSYLTSDKKYSSFSNFNGNYNDLTKQSYGGSPLNFNLSSTNNPLDNLTNTLESSQKGYLAFDVNSTNVELDNGFTLNSAGFSNNYNPELVFELTDAFWADYQSVLSGIENQKITGNSIKFEADGLGKTIDLSALRSIDEDLELEDFIDNFNFTVVTDQRWELPLYGTGNITANVQLFSESDDGSPAYVAIGAQLRDHDFDGHQVPNTQGFSGAVELTDNGDSTVLEFGFDYGQIKNIIREVQENWNSTGSNTIFEVQDVSINLNNLPSGGSYHLHKEITSGEQVLTLKPVTTETSDFSEFGDIDIELTGDFDSIIDIWTSDENSPSIYLTSKEIFTRYEHATLNLRYEAVDEFGQTLPGKHLTLNSSINDITGTKVDANFTGSDYSGEIADFKLTSINFNANPWNIQTSSQTPSAAIDPTVSAAVAAMDPADLARLVEVGMDPVDAARVAAMDPADLTRITAMDSTAVSAIAAMDPAAAAIALGTDPATAAALAALAKLSPADAATAASAIGMDPEDAAKVAAMDPAAASQIASMSPAAGAAGTNPGAAANTNVNWNFSVDENGQFNTFTDNEGNSVSIYDYINDADDLKQLKISGLNDLSQADQLDASVELTLNNDRLPWNVNYTGPEITNTLETYYSLQELDQLAVLGDSVNEDSVYDLTITAKMLGDLRLEGAGLKIEFDNTLFKDLEASDIQLGSSFVKAYDDNKTGYGPIRVDNTNGEIYISAMSAEDLGWGHAISEESVFAKISLDFDEEELRKIDQNSDGSLKIQDEQLEFDIKASLDDTIFTEDYDDGSGLSNRKIQSLRELNKGITVKGRDVTLYDASINLEQQDNGLVLGTQRIIGSDSAFTNLIRSGDTLSTSATWLNVGNIEANNIKVQGIKNDNAVLAGSSISKTSLKSGSFIDGKFDEAGREDLKLTADIEITGEAGEVLNLAEGILTVEAEGSQIFSNAGKGSSNLITFQGDLNYDGRVSMKDLAFLNAGAARQQSTAESSGEDADGNGIVDASLAQDVDADFNGKIDMADLTVLDQDWGNSLHTGTSQGFTGSSADLTWETLDAQGGTTWDNSSFKAQNAIEADDGYVGSLETTTGSSALGAINEGQTQEAGINNAVDPEPPLV